jgi:hypothetical protein
MKSLTTSRTIRFAIALFAGAALAATSAACILPGSGTTPAPSADRMAPHASAPSMQSVQSKDAPAGMKRVMSATNHGKRITVDAVSELSAAALSASANLAKPGYHYVRLDVTQVNLDGSSEGSGYNATNFTIVGSDGKAYQYVGWDRDGEWFTSGYLKGAGESLSGQVLFSLPNGVSPREVFARFGPLDEPQLVATVS